MAQTNRTTGRRSRPHEERVPDWGVYVFESHHSDDFHMTPRRHDFVKVLMVLSGSGKVWIGQKSHACEAGQVIVVPRGKVNRIEDAVREPLSLYALCVRPGVWEQVDDGLERRWPSGAMTPGEAEGRRLRAMLRRLLFLQTRGEAAGRSAGFGRSGASLRSARGLRVEMAGLAMQGLAMVVRMRERGAGRRDLRGVMAGYVAELEQRFYEVRSIDAEAGRCRMSRRRFTQLFREATGRSWGEHVRRLRLTHAQHLLAGTDRTVAAIAFECGFGDLSSFYRVFAPAVGRSPLEYRQLRRD